METYNILNMTDLSVLFNCSILEDYNFRSRMLASNISVFDISLEASKAAGFGTITGVFAVCVLNIVESIEMKQTSQSNIKIKFDFIKSISRTIVFLTLVLIAPMLLILLLLAFMYKIGCSVIIKRRDTHFVAFLDSVDVFWSLEEDATKSIINVLGVIESDCPQALVDRIKDKLKDMVVYNDAKKIFYRRNEEYGFYYWRRYSCIDMDEYVQIVNISGGHLKNKETDLEELMTEISIKALPFNDEGLFQILITRQRIGNHENEKGKYGIIFRVHHSLGDGVALFELLCQTLADNTEDESGKKFAMPEIYNMNNRNPSDLLKMIKTLYEIPVCLIDGILRKPDNNTLHGPSLLGKKLYKWTASDENLLMKVKEIKENAENMTFTDVLGAALSHGLQHFFLKTMDHIPEYVGVILPIRLPQTTTSDKLNLENNFTVSIVDLPIGSQPKAIKNCCDKIRKSADPMTNHYLLKICNILPKHILQRILYSNQATMVFSNLPGPISLSLCGGNALKSMVFFIPHKGTTGFSATALCYGGVLRLAVSADTALVTDPDNLTIILDGMVDAIGKMHRKYVTK